MSRGDGFVVFQPFAASFPGETWIVPSRHRPAFVQVSEDELLRFASTLRTTLRQMGDAFGDPDFNYVLQSGPSDADPSWHWYLQLIPRLTKLAGFELGSGVHINTMAPEDGAAAMRAAGPRSPSG